MSQQISTGVSSDRLPPGPRGLPFLGSLLSIRKDPHIMIDRIAKQYGDVCILHLGKVPTVIISHPELLQEAFTGAELADRWVGQVMGILSHHGKDLALAPHGEHWRQLQRFANRELLTLRRLQQIRENHVEDVVNGLVASVGELADTNQLMDPIQMLSQSNALIMFRAIFGRSEKDTAEFEAKRDELLDFVFWVFRNATAANPADYLPWLRVFPTNAIRETESRKAVRDEILNFLIDAVQSRPDLDLDNPTCLIEVMLARQAAGELERETILLLVGDLLLAGIDTSAQTVCWLLLVLANRPAIQHKVHEELDRAIGPDRLPTLEDREQLPYLNAVIMENMRYRTVGPLGLPHKAAVSCQVGGFSIPAGAQVLGNIYSIHHDPRFWDSPDEFRPERFLPQDDGSPSAATTSGSFIPFGVGRRSCPGWRFGEMLVWMHASRLLSKYEFLTPQQDWLPEDEVFGLTVSPKPYSLRVRRRTD